MITYSQSLALMQQMAKVATTDTPNSALLVTLWNDSIRTVCNINGGKLRFLEAVKNMATVAGQEGYQTPNGFRKLMSIVIWSEATTAGVPYTPEMIFDPTIWNKIKQAKLGSGDLPLATYVEAQKFYIQPVPSTSGLLIQLRGRLQTNDLSIADYTTGTIVSVANGGTAVVGSGTTWTADMVGRYIRITQTTAANGGDGFWYQIGSYTSATSIGLLKPYEGTTIAAGSAAYTIGQCSYIPEAYEMAPIYRAVAIFTGINDPTHPEISKNWWRRYDGGQEIGESKLVGGLIGQMLENEGETEEGAYVPPAGMNQSTGMAGPYYYPMQDASGF